MLLLLMTGIGFPAAANPAAGNGGIRGKIFTDVNTPANGATIRLKGA